MPLRIGSLLVVEISHEEEWGVPLTSKMTISSVLVKDRHNLGNFTRVCREIYNMSILLLSGTPSPDECSKYFQCSDIRNAWRIYSLKRTWRISNLALSVALHSSAAAVNTRSDEIDIATVPEILKPTWSGDKSCYSFTFSPLWTLGMTSTNGNKNHDIPPEVLYIKLSK